MLHLSTATPERFSSLSPDPAADLERLRRNLDRGAVRPEHLLVATDDRVDVARASLITEGDGTTLAYAFRVDPGRSDVEQVYRVLLDGVAEATRSAGLAEVHTMVLDVDEPAPSEKRAALAAAGWELDSDRLELEAETAVHTRADDIVEVDPSHPEVVAVMAAAMADSLDDYDQNQVATLGAADAASAYRDMMADTRMPVPWLAHRGPEGLDGIAAIKVFPTDWCVGYLGVVPDARRTGVGAALARAMLSATAEAGVAKATASVAVANTPIRATLEGAGFTVRSPRTDFVLRIDG